MPDKNKLRNETDRLYEEIHRMIREAVDVCGQKEVNTLLLEIEKKLYGFWTYSSYLESKVEE